MLQPQHAACETLPPLKWVVGDPAQYLGPQQQGHPAAQQQHEQQYRNVIPRQPAENEEVMWRSTAHHMPTAMLVHPEAGAATSSPSRVHYAQQQMIQQGAYPQGGEGAVVDGRMGLRVGAEVVLWGATSGFVQGGWELVSVPSPFGIFGV